MKNFTLALALLAASVVAQTLYFYPPDDAKWIAGRSYISSGTATTAQALSIDPDRCGWYKASIPSSSPLRNIAQFWLGKVGTDKIGPNGRWATDFEPTDDFNAVGGVFRLGDIFSRLGNNIYFVADELDPTDPNSGWYGADPGIIDESRCRFELAAFIYDTDPAVHPDFSCGIYSYGASEGNGPDTKGACAESPAAYSGAGGNLKPNCRGVTKGLVKPNLNPTTRKIEYSGNDSKGCWTSSDWFSKAFTPTPGVNVQRCYNMPFTQVRTGVAAGSFEFDSDKMLNANGRLVGGFFPELLNSAPADASCPSCNTKRSADRFTPRIKEITSEMFYAYQSKDGDFADGDTPTRSAFGITSLGTESIYDWVARTESSTTNPNWSPWYLHGNTALKNTYDTYGIIFDANAKANQHFCFESHADFYYDPAQEFYFGGDDDIWVYINNKLVIDLGGNHMAAPGSVKLSTLGLTEGNLYPIDIFVCDRRTTNSSVRLTTNLYIAQKSNFYNSLDRTENPMCVLYQGGADCTSKMGMGGATGQQDLCGPALINGGFKVDFYMVRRGTQDTIWLSGAKNTKDCQGNAETFSCFGGIQIDKAIYHCGGRGQCRGNPEATAKVNVMGNFNVYARLMGSDGRQVPGSKPLMIDQFENGTNINIRIVWGNLISEDGRISATLKDADGKTTTQNQQVLAGKRTPIYIASGSWSNTNTFVYDNDPESVAGAAYSVTVSGGTGLTIYRNKTGTEKKTSGALPPSGIDTLWVEGDYDMGDKTYSLNVVGESESAPSLKLTISQPVESCSTIGLYSRSGSINSASLCLCESSSGKPICGATLAPRLSYYVEIPGITKVDLRTTPNCEWTSKAVGKCYGSGIVLENGTVTVNGSALPTVFAQYGFELYASVDGYTFKISDAKTVPIMTVRNPLPQSQEPRYYTLKGEPLGSEKPSKLGVYILWQNGEGKIYFPRLGL